MKPSIAIALITCTALVTSARPFAAPQRGSAAAAPPSEDTRQQLMASLDKAAAFLMQQRKVDGTLDANPGVTAVAATALLRQTGKSRDAQARSLSKTLDYIAAMAKPDGGIYTQQIPHYITPVSVSALAAAGRPQD